MLAGTREKRKVCDRREMVKQNKHQAKGFCSHRCTETSSYKLKAANVFTILLMAITSFPMEKNGNHDTFFLVS